MKRTETEEETERDVTGHAVSKGIQALRAQRRINLLTKAEIEAKYGGEITSGEDLAAMGIHP